MHSLTLILSILPFLLLALTGFPVNGQIQYTFFQTVGSGSCPSFGSPPAGSRQCTLDSHCTFGAERCCKAASSSGGVVSFCVAVGYVSTLPVQQYVIQQPAQYVVSTAGQSERFQRLTSNGGTFSSGYYNSALKAGVCPTVYTLGCTSVIRRCEADSNCGGTAKCCGNGCGTVCTEPGSLDEYIAA
ncbi:hypothetical protein BV898_17223 [Hypsibius exemplaris]|uniref:WAP domain-containing protein n=1 Tax=Hypsibius exemplaris TaxID=2072580 RepID=A0A9X6NLW8_HYPEX|nr:hypothetical protein BV898_17223 [Hypsibius exemplaris]